MDAKWNRLIPAAIALLSSLALDRGIANALPAATCPSIAGTYAFAMDPAKSFSADVLTDAADPAGILGAPRQDVGRVGILDVDSSCGVTGKSMALTDTNTGDTNFIEFNFTGVISDTKGGAAGIRPNGKGFLQINDPAGADIVDCENMTTDPPTDFTPANCADDEGKETYALVFSRPMSGGNRQLEAIQIDNVGGGAKIFLRIKGDRL